MISRILDPSVTQLVGIMGLHDPQASIGTVEFISLTIADGAPIRLDRPNVYVFNLPVSDIQSEPDRISFLAGSLQFEGFLDEGKFVGTVQDAAEHMQGDFELYPTYALAPGEYKPLIGHYRLDPDHEFSLSWSDLPGGPAYFYNTEDEVVRLYPTGPSTFYSDRLDTLAFAPSFVSIESCDGTTGIAERVHWCREEQISITVEDYQLAGTLMLPPTEGSHPLVILCHLANTHQRDYYRLYADWFVRNGIAAFIYDKRGNAESTGTRLFSEVFPLADDATAIYRYMQKHPSINPDRIGLWGISNGAWVAPLAAERAGDAAFVIAAACSGVSPARQEQLRRANVARDLGASPRAVDLLLRFWHAMFRFNTGGEWNAELESLIEQVDSDEELQALPRHPDHALGLQPVPPIRPIDQIRAKSGGSWKEGAFEVSEVLANLSCPVLCVWGEQDEVLPVAESIERIEQAMHTHDRTDYRLEVIPNATHTLYLVPTPPTGILAEVMQTHLHNVEFAPNVRRLMADWASARL